MSIYRIICLFLAGLAAAAALAPASLAYVEVENGALPVAAQPTAQGEPKSQQPFTSPAAPVATLAVAPGSGFDWTDAMIGAAAGVGLTLAAVGGATLGRHSRSPQTAY
jgi:hypothetical protein